MSRRATSGVGPPQPRRSSVQGSVPTVADATGPSASVAAEQADGAGDRAAGAAAPLFLPPVEAETATAPTTDSPAETPAPLPVLTHPAEGVPPVLTTERELADAADRIAAGSGPVALDAERASGYRYSGRAYLVQLRREGAGSFLIDPIALPDLSPIQEAIGDAEWVLHAATQDLACLAEIGLHPTRLFDTELGSRLAGLPRVGLAAVTEHYLHVSLAKEHSAVDWSTRPLPEPWLRYAALDVEALIEVRDALAEDLRAQGKAELAGQEFDALTRFTGPPLRTDPWRRTSSMHKVRNRRGLARVRSLWQTRDAIARERDISPGRILPDALIIDMALADPRTDADLIRATTPAGGRSRPAHRSVTRYRDQWLRAVREADALPEGDLPTSSLRSDAPPPARAWADRDPVAAARLQQVRDALTEHGEQVSVPIENLLTPDSLRRVLWRPPTPADEAGFTRELSALGARAWQVDLVVPLLVAAVADHPSTDK